MDFSSTKISGMGKSFMAQWADISHFFPPQSKENSLDRMKSYFFFIIAIGLDPSSSRLSVHFMLGITSLNHKLNRSY